MTDSDTNLSSLKLDWASRNSLKQRAGRVGRVANGRVYRLITEQFYHVRTRLFRFLSYFILFYFFCHLDKYISL